MPLPAGATRVVSLVPSLSELAYYLNPNALIGRTRFCVFPTEIVVLPKVGGTKDVDLQKVKDLQPDLVLAAKEENIREQIEAISGQFQVEVFDIKSVEDALTAILRLGELLGRPSKALDLVTTVNHRRSAFRKKEMGSALYLIWQNPWMTVGSDTYIHAMLEEAGFNNLGKFGTRYPKLDSLDDIKSLNPRHLLLSSEPYPFKEKDLRFFQSHLPGCHVGLVDGTYFSWYGSRLAEFYSYIETEVYPT